MNVWVRLKKRACWEVHKSWDFVYKKFCFKPRIMKYDECIDYINKNRASLSRMGDGELVCMFGKDLKFQESTADLRMALNRVCHSKKCNWLLGIPDVFDDIERYDLVEQRFWQSHLYFNRKKWYTFVRKDGEYANAFLSRFYSMEYDRKLSEWRLRLLKTLWQNRNLITIEGENSKIGVGNDLFDNALSIRRVITPSKNAFRCYNDILDVAKKEASTDCLFIVALGPTATVLAYDLSVAGYQALDLGHFDIEYEWYKMRAKSKVPVTGKFSNEAAILSNVDSEVVGVLLSENYEKQIIARIV